LAERAAAAYAEADGVVLLAREVDRLDLLRHEREVRLLLVVAVEVVELNLDLLGRGQLVVGLRRRGAGASGAALAAPRAAGAHHAGVCLYLL
jgi:hypothetical protein